MKITKVTPWIVSGPPEEAGGRQARGGMLSYVFVQVETDEGLTGWGEITTYPGPIANRTIAAVVCQRFVDAVTILPRLPTMQRDAASHATAGRRKRFSMHLSVTFRSTSGRTHRVWKVRGGAPPA